MKSIIVFSSIIGLVTAVTVSEAAAWGCAARPQVGPTGRSWGQSSESAAQYVALKECKIGATLRGMGPCRVIACNPFVNSRWAARATWR